jgi:hypothetical protein
VKEGKETRLLISVLPATCQLSKLAWQFASVHNLTPMSKQSVILSSYTLPCNGVCPSTPPCGLLSKCQTLSSGINLIASVYARQQYSGLCSIPIFAKLLDPSRTNPYPEPDRQFACYTSRPVPIWIRGYAHLHEYHGGRTTQHRFHDRHEWRQRSDTGLCRSM